MRRSGTACASLLALMALALSLSLASCGGKQSETARSEQQTAVSTPLSAKDLFGTVWKAGDGGVTDGFFLHFTSETRCYLILCRDGGWNAVQRLDFKVEGTTLDLGKGFQATVADDGSSIHIVMPDKTSWDFELTNGSNAPEDELETNLKNLGQIFDLGDGEQAQAQSQAQTSRPATDTPDFETSVGNISVVTPGWAVDMGLGWIQYGDSLRLEYPDGRDRVQIAELDWDERAAIPYEIKEERWELGTTYSSGVERAVVLHISYVDGNGRVIYGGSDVSSDVLAPEYYAKLSAEEILSWITVGEAVPTAGSRNADGLYLGSTPFWGVWAYASKDLGEAVGFAQDARSRGFDAEVLLTTDWSNLNSEPWYVVTLGIAGSEGDAYDILSDAQSSVYGDAYVKWSGDYIG